MVIPLCYDTLQRLAKSPTKQLNTSKLFRNPFFSCTHTKVRTKVSIIFRKT